MITKVCTKCGQELPATTEYFYKHSSGKYGLRGECKQCRNNKIKEWYIDNHEKCLNNSKSWKLNNPGKESEFARLFRFRHREQILKYKAEYRQQNKDLIRLKDKEYRQNNPEIRQIQKQRRRSLQKQLPASLSKTQWQKIKNDFNSCCVYCGNKIKLTQDHFIALSKGGEYSTNNILPACLSCNASKNNNNFFEWYPKQSFYSKDREAKILKYLNYNPNTLSQQLALII